MRDLHSEGLIEAASQLITNNYRQAEQVFKDIEHELHNYERFFTVLNFAL